MQTLVIDTYKVITRLQQKGFTKDQAEALVSAAQDLDLSGIATKEDLQDLKLDLIKWMVGTQLAYGAIIVAILLTR
jgi:hypothetical protein